MTARLLPLAGLALVLYPRLAAALQPTAAQPQDNCITCHEILGDERLSGPVAAFAADIHRAQGFSCGACHGGDPTVSGLEGMDPAKGFVGRPGALGVQQLCGRCHDDARFMRRFNPSLRVDQTTEYLTSVHGQRLTQLGDSSVATCISCHTAHTIRPASDPLSSVHPLVVAETCGACHASATHMAGYDIPTDQVEKFRASVHWQMMSEEGDLSAPTCNDCHGNHGAAPPGISWVGNTCGQCHSVTADLFSESVHAQIFPLMGVPGCAACHDNHAIQKTSDAMLGLGEGAVCTQCHQAGVGGGVGAARMRALIDSLRAEFDTAHALLLEAERAGMEVSQAQFDLDGARNYLITARTAVHAFNVEAVESEIIDGLEITTSAVQRGLAALRELQFRRIGLAVSVSIIVILIVGLVLKIRDMERGRSGAEEGSST